MEEKYFMEARPEFSEVRKQVEEMLKKSKFYFGQEWKLHNDLANVSEFNDKLALLPIALMNNPEYEKLNKLHNEHLDNLEKSWSAANRRFLELGVRPVEVSGALGKLKPASPEEDLNQYYSSVKNLITKGIEETRLRSNVSDELKTDKDMILKAVAGNKNSVNYASEEIRSDKEINKKAISGSFNQFMEKKLAQVQLDIENGADPKIVLNKLNMEIMSQISNGKMPTIQEKGFNIGERISMTLENKEKYKVFEITSDILLKRNFDISSKCASGYYNQDLLNSAGGRLLHLTALNNPDALQTFVYKGGADINMIKPEWIPNEETKKEVERMQFEKNHPVKSALGIRN